MGAPSPPGSGTSATVPVTCEVFVIPNDKHGEAVTRGWGGARTLLVVWVVGCNARASGFSGDASSDVPVNLVAMTDVGLGSVDGTSDGSLAPWSDVLPMDSPMRDTMVDNGSMDFDGGESGTLDGGPWAGVWHGEEQGRYTLNESTGGDITGMGSGPVMGPETLTIAVTGTRATITRTSTQFSSPCTLMANLVGSTWTYVRSSCRGGSLYGQTVTLTAGSLELNESGVVATEATSWTFSGEDSHGDTLSGSQSSITELSR